MRAILGRVNKLEDALATEIKAQSQADVAATLERLSEEQLELLEWAAVAYRAGRPFSDEERAAMRAYEVAMHATRTPRARV